MSTKRTSEDGSPVPFEPVDPAVLGASVAHARKKAGFTQDSLAKQIGVSRPTLIAMESGQRPITELELHAIAQKLGSSVRDFLNLGAPDVSASVRFRALRGADDSQPALEALEDFGRRYVRLEQLAKDRIVRREPATFMLERATNTERAGEELAATERLRLGLGDGPLPDLRVVFEEDAGLRIFGLEELRRTRISGLFAYSREYGPLVGFNAAHDPRRVRWTLCHEYAHYLSERYEPEITIEGRPGRRDRREVFADSFAAHFLMPATGLSRRFSEMLSDAGGELKVAHLLMLAQFFEVSFQAITQRLEEIGRVTAGTYEMLRERGFKPLEAETLLGFERRPLDRLPFRYVFLVATLHARGLLSEGDAATFLRTDRLAARQLLQGVPEAGEADDGSEPGLDTPIGVAN
jgi:Zn-dependent peptidase ImmA (M78 family)/DNA-binding XRE family transcriptional regulator